MNTYVNIDIISGLAFGAEVFWGDDECGTALVLHLFFIRIYIERMKANEQQLRKSD